MEAIKDGALYLTPRDYEVLKFINIFGKSYVTVLHRIFFKNNTRQVCANRLSTLKKKYKLLKFTKTGAYVPRNYVSLSDAGRRFIEEVVGVEANNVHFSLMTMQHNMIEQLAYYAISLVYPSVERCKVRDWASTHHHTPDLVFTNKNGGLTYVEVELTKKTHSRYAELFSKMEKDGVDAVLYVVKDEKMQERLLEFLPKWEKIWVINIDAFLKKAEEEGKISGVKQ